MRADDTVIGEGRVASSGDLRLRAIDLAIVLSVLAHGLALWLSQVSWLPRVLPPSPDAEGKGAQAGRLDARIALPPPASAAPPPAAPASPGPLARPAERPAPAPQAKSAPQRSAPARPAPVITGAGAPAVVAPESPRAEPAPARPAAGAPAPPDMDAMLRSRREARGEAAPSAAASPPPRADAETERRDRAVLANLGTLRAPSPGESGARGGGVFELRSRGVEEAEFLFFGWNRDMQRNNTQLIVVRRGGNPNIELAVVRRMVAIIREHEQGDFDWYSSRQRRHFTLSARPRDTAELEAFLLRDFF